MPATKKRNRIDKSLIKKESTRCQCLEQNNSIGVCELDIWHGVSIHSDDVSKYGPLLHKAKRVERVQCSTSYARETMYFLLSRPWIVLLVILTLAFIGLTFFFGAMLWLCEKGIQDDRWTPFLDLSLQTLSTIGYGHLNPHSTCANWVVVAEAFTSMFGNAFIAGIAFAKFAKPTASLLFSNCFTVCKQGEKIVMQFRVLNASRSTNASQNEIYDAWFRVTLVRVQPTTTGRHVLCSYTLELEQTNYISLRLEACLTHVIDETSPFFGFSRDELLASDFEIYIIVSGVDSTLHDTIHDQHVYHASQLRWSERFNKMIEWNLEKQQLLVDYAAMSKTTVEKEDLEQFRQAQMQPDVPLPYWIETPDLTDSDGDSKSPTPTQPHWDLIRFAKQSNIITRRRGNSTFLDPLHEAMNSRQFKQPSIEEIDIYSTPGRSTPLLESQEKESSGLGWNASTLIHRLLRLRWKKTTKKKGNLEEEIARQKLPQICHRNRRRAWLPSSLYYKSLDMTWFQLMVVIVVSYFLVNAVFAGLAILESDSILNFESETDRFDSAFQAGFFFSVQTLSTVGFGTLSPNPDAYLVNIIVFIEALLGIAAATIITGVTWAKFSIPQNTTIVFSKSILLTTFHGDKCLMFRAGNTRRYGDILESTFKVAVIISNPTTGSRELKELNLVQDVWPIFKYCSTVIHRIDENSPLSGLSFEQLQADQVTIVVLFTGLDTTLDDSVYARRTYVTEEISNGQVFQDNVELFHDFTRVNFEKLNGTNVVL